MNSLEFFSRLDYNDYVEKLNEKTGAWIKKWMSIENGQVYFYDKKPGKKTNKINTNFYLIFIVNEIEISRPKESYSLENCSLKLYKEYKAENSTCKKKFVLEFNFSTGNIFLVFKNETFLQRLADLAPRSRKLENSHPCNKENQDVQNADKNYQKNQANHSFTLSKHSNISKSHLSSGKRGNLHLNTKPDGQTNKSLYLTFKSNDEMKKPLKTSINSNSNSNSNPNTLQTNQNYNGSSLNNSSLNNPQRLVRHYKTKSCGTHDTIDTIHNGSNSIFNNSDTKKETLHVNYDNSSNLAKYKKLSLARENKKLNNINSVRERSLQTQMISRDNLNTNTNSNSNCNRHVLNPLNITMNNTQRQGEVKDMGQKNKMSQFSDFFPSQNEENLSLQQMIGTMISTRKKNKASDSFLEERAEQSFIEEHEEQDLNISHNYSRYDPRESNLNEKSQRKLKSAKRISKIIKLSLPSNILVVTDSQRKDVLRLPSKEAYCKGTLSFKPTKLDFDQNLTQYDKEKEVKLNFNLSQEELSFEDKEKSTNSAIIEEKESPHENNQIKELLSKLENFEEYYFDSTILYNLVKSHSLKKDCLGHLYLQSNNENLKSQLLCEMISQLSKTFLKKSIIKSLSIVLKEKNLNKNFFISPNHQHSIEFCIVDIFNTFLGANHESEDFYTKILPNFLSEKYNLPFIPKLKERVSIPNIFVLMQNCNRVFFEDNLNVNFNTSYPFVVQDIKYISPYNVNKWYILAVEEEEKTKFQTQKNVSNNMTNMKRMKYAGFELKDTFETSLNYLKKAEKEREDYRVSLIRSIYFHVYNKRNELALKLCDYYVQKFSDTLFLNPIVYLILAEVYSETHGTALARMFFEKALNLLSWQFSGDINPILIDLYYTYSLILFKHNLENPQEEDLVEIEEHLKKCHTLCGKFFHEEHEKKVKITLQICLVKLTKDEKNYSESLFEDILKSVLALQKNRMFKEAVIYLNLFIDILNPMKIVGEEKKIVLIQKLHEVKKEISGKSF